MIVKKDKKIKIKAIKQKRVYFPKKTKKYDYFTL